MGCCGVGLPLFVSALLVLALAAKLQLAALPALCSSLGWGCTCMAPPPDDWPQFLVLGDWGREGRFNQSEVAAAMSRKAGAMRVDFVVSTGDNFYPHGLSSPSDPAFLRSFSSIYYQRSLQVPWHSVLGNHDYGQSKSPDSPDCGKWDPDCFFSPLHQLDARLAARDPRWHCERSFQLTLAGGRVDMFFIDTTPLMTDYEAVVWRSNRGGLGEQSWEGEMRELEGRLARSRAPWKLVVGHHPIRTNHRAWHIYPEMRDRLEPLLIKHGAAAYFNGHDHTLQHIHAPSAGYHQINSGAGSRVGRVFHGTKHSPFQHAGNGFVAVRLRQAGMTVEYLGLDSDEPLFSIEVPPRG